VSPLRFPDGLRPPRIGSDLPAGLSSRPALKGVQSGKRSLFSKTRPSRADPFQPVLQTYFYKIKRTCFRLSGRNEQRSTLTPMVAFAVLRLQNPAGAQRPVTFSFFGRVTPMHIQSPTVHPIQVQIKLPPTPPALPARYATLRSQPTTMYTHIWICAKSL
jgi:hypothetical protein